MLMDPALIKPNGNVTQYKQYKKKKHSKQYKQSGGDWTPYMTPIKNQGYMIFSSTFMACRYFKLRERLDLFYAYHSLPRSKIFGIINAIFTCLSQTWINKRFL